MHCDVAQDRKGPEAPISSSLRSFRKVSEIASLVVWTSAAKTVTSTGQPKLVFLRDPISGSENEGPTHFSIYNLRSIRIICVRCPPDEIKSPWDFLEFLTMRYDFPYPYKIKSEISSFNVLTPIERGPRSLFRIQEQNPGQDIQRIGWNHTITFGKSKKKTSLNTKESSAKRNFVQVPNRCSVQDYTLSYHWVDFPADLGPNFPGSYNYSTQLVLDFGSILSDEVQVRHRTLAASKDHTSVFDTLGKLYFIVIYPDDKIRWILHIFLSQNDCVQILIITELQAAINFLCLDLCQTISANL